MRGPTGLWAGERRGVDAGALVGFERNDRRVVALVVSERQRSMRVVTSDPQDLRRLDASLDVVPV